MDAASIECRITRGREGWGGQRSAFERNLDDRKQVLGLAGPTRADHLQTQRSSPSAQALDPEEAKEDASASPDGQDPLPASSPGLGRAAGAQAGNSLPTQPRGALGNMSSGPPRRSMSQINAHLWPSLFIPAPLLVCLRRPKQPLTDHKSRSESTPWLVASCVKRRR